MSERSMVRVSKPIQVIVDYRLDPKTILEAGNYDFICFEVIDIVRTLNLLIENDRTEIVDVFLVCIGQVIPTNRILNVMDHEGFRPATLPELLSLGAICPWLQLGFRIVALGTQSCGECGIMEVPMLCEIDDRRHLSMVQAGPTNGSWKASDRFLAVRKRMSSTPLIQ